MGFFSKINREIRKGASKVNREIHRPFRKYGGQIYKTGSRRVNQWGHKIDDHKMEVAAVVAAIYGIPLMLGGLGALAGGGALGTALGSAGTATAAGSGLAGSMAAALPGYAGTVGAMSGAAAAMGGAAGTGLTAGGIGGAIGAGAAQGAAIGMTGGALAGGIQHGRDGFEKGAGMGAVGGAVTGGVAGGIGGIAGNTANVGNSLQAGNYGAAAGQVGMQVAGGIAGQAATQELMDANVNRKMEFFINQNPELFATPEMIRDGQTTAGQELSSGQARDETALSEDTAFSKAPAGDTAFNQKPLGGGVGRKGALDLGQEAFSPSVTENVQTVTQPDENQFLPEAV